MALLTTGARGAALDTETMWSSVQTARLDALCCIYGPDAEHVAIAPIGLDIRLVLWGTAMIRHLPPSYAGGSCVTTFGTATPEDERLSDEHADAVK